MGTLNVGGGTLSFDSSGNWTSAPPGTIIQVQSVKIGPTTQTITSVSPTLITGLSINFTPKSASSKIISNISISTNNNFVSSYALYQNGSSILSTAGFANSNQPNMDITQYLSTNTNDNNMMSVYFQSILDAGSTAQRNYAVYATSGWVNTPLPLVINNRANSDMASFSTMVIYEVSQ